jgi:hypothetical protein
MPSRNFSTGPVESAVKPLVEFHVKKDDMVAARSSNDNDAGKTATESTGCLGRRLAREANFQRRGYGSPICDFRKGCAIIRSLCALDLDQVRRVVCSTLHLAEALVRLGFPRTSSTVDMALALQEARQSPPGDCICLAEKTEKPEAPVDRQGSSANEPHAA